MAPVTKTSVELTPSVLISVAAMLLLFPLKWIFAWLVAAMIHESCHCLALIILGHPIYKVQLLTVGARIHTEPLPYSHQVFCSLSGPIGGLSLLFCASLYPQLAFCALSQSVFNLLPIHPLDGGRALYGFICCIFSTHTANKIYKLIESVFIVILLINTILLGFRLGSLPALLFALLLLKTKGVKIPCKWEHHRVQ